MGNSLTLPKDAPIDIPHASFTEQEILLTSTLRAGHPPKEQVKALIDLGVDTWQIPMGEIWNIVDVYTVSDSRPTPEIGLILLVDGMQAHGPFYFWSVNLWKHKTEEKVTWKELRSALRRHERLGLRRSIPIRLGFTLEARMFPLDITGPHPMRVTFRAWLQRFKL